MQGVTTKEKLIILASEKPITYTELRSQLRISDPVLQKHLADLREAGLLTKNEEGKYILTEKGIEEAKNAKFRQEGNLGQYLERESDLEVILNAKIALALRKTLTFLFDARYLAKNFPKKFDVKQSELEAHAEVIKRLLVERYDPTFDLVKEEADEQKYLHWSWGEHVPGFAQLSQWLYKNWFAKMENLVSLIETLPSSATRNEIISALLAVCKVMKGIGMDTNEIERRLTSLQGSGP